MALKSASKGWLEIKLLRQRVPSVAALGAATTESGGVICPLG